MIQVVVIPRAVLLLFVLGSLSRAQSAAPTRSAFWSPASCFNLDCSGSSNWGVTLVPYGGWLYAATLNDAGTQLWRRVGTTGTTWSRLTTPISTDNKSIRDPAVHQGKLYLGTSNELTGCEVWRHDSFADDWHRVDPGGGFGDPRTEEASGMGSYLGLLFVGTADEAQDVTAQVWAYDALAPTPTWTDVTPPWSSNVFEADGFVEYQGRMYVGASNEVNGCEIWSYDGANWNLELGGGFGFGPAQVDARAMAVHGGALFVGTENDAGCQVHRYDGTTWDKVGGPPPAARNDEVISLISFGGHLYAGTESVSNRQTGVWRWDGMSWTETTPRFGAPGTFLAWSLVEYQGRLHVATANEWFGARVWRH